MDSLLPSDKDAFLAPTDRSFSSVQSNVLEADQRSLQAQRTKSNLSCGRLCAMFCILVILMLFAGFIFLIYEVARGVENWIREPHFYNIADDNTTSVIKSYYGERIPHFNILANVYVRFGKEIAVSESRGNGTQSRDPTEEEMFGEWESIFSQVIYTNMDINSTTKIFHKTVNLSIPQNALARMYESHTYFPQIVNTFVVVPSNQDPALLLPRPPTMTAFNITDAIHPDPALTSWTQYPLDKLVRPIDPRLNTINDDDESRWKNASASLDEFYDAAAVREHALRPVRDRWTSWSRLEPSKNETNLTTASVPPAQGELYERNWLHVQRNASVKIKTNTGIAMSRQIPTYDLEQYQSSRRGIASEMMNVGQDRPDIDRLNRLGPHILRKDFHAVGHTVSHLVQVDSSANTSSEESRSELAVKHSSAFYGPILSINGHAAGLHDWITLPRVNTSSDKQSGEDPFFVPWRITFELRSNLKSFAVEKTSWLVEEPFIESDEHPVNVAYNEVQAFESGELWNTIWGYNNLSLRRPVLRVVFHFLGFVVGFPVLVVLQAFYVYTRNLSTGISIPSNFLFLSLRVIQAAYLLRSGSRFMKVCNAIGLAMSLSAIWFWGCLWWGFEIQWGGWSGILPVGVKRIQSTHSERRSMRVDSRFTWLQRSVFVIVSTICLAHVHRLPHFISATHQYTTFIVTPPPHSSHIGNIIDFISKSKYTYSFVQAVDLMGTTSQFLLNKRLGRFGGSYPLAAWIDFVAMVLDWAPTVLRSIFGVYQTSPPVHFWTMFTFLIKGIVLWQSLKYPVVKQDEDEEEDE